MAGKTPYSFRCRLEYLLARLFFFPILILPLAITLPIGHALGRVIFYLLPARRKIALDNVRQALGGEKSEKECARIARHSFANFGMNIIELIKFPVLAKRADLERFYDLENVHYGQELYAEGRGVLFVTGHIGNWEMASMISCREGVPFCSVARPLSNGFLDDYLTGLRESCGQKIVKKRGALKQLIRELKAGGAPAFLIDQNARKRGVIVKFFGRDASTIPSVAALAMKLNLSVVAGACYRIGHRFRFRFVNLPPLTMVDTGDYQADLVANTQVMTDAIEQLIRRAPEQWLWAHNRWRIKESWLSEGRLAVGRS